MPWKFHSCMHILNPDSYIPHVCYVWENESLCLIKPNSNDVLCIFMGKSVCFFHREVLPQERLIISELNHNGNIKHLLQVPRQNRRCVVRNSVKCIIVMLLRKLDSFKLCIHHIWRAAIFWNTAMYLTVQYWHEMLYYEISSGRVTLECCIDTV